MNYKQSKLKSLEIERKRMIGGKFKLKNIDRRKISFIKNVMANPDYYIYLWFNT